MSRTPRKLGDTQPLLRDLASLEAEATARHRISEDTVELPKARPRGTFGYVSSESAVLPLPASSPSVGVDRSTWQAVVIVLLGVTAVVTVAIYS